MGATSEMKVTEQSKRGRGGGSIHKQKYQPLTGTFEKAVTGRSNTTSTACRFGENSHSQKWSLRIAGFGDGSAKLTLVCSFHLQQGGCFTRI
jgi:hypothetical protein